MSRPKRGTPAGDKATAKWRATMTATYGSVSEKMKYIGSIGGSATGVAKGFAADVPCTCDEFEQTHLVRQCSGRKGGRISRAYKKVETNV